LAFSLWLRLRLRSGRFKHRFCHRSGLLLSECSLHDGTFLYLGRRFLFGHQLEDALFRRALPGLLSRYSLVPELLGDLSTPLEPLNLPCSVDNSLLTGEEWVARRAHLGADFGLS
jgi:hypothetical protein